MIVKEKKVSVLCVTYNQEKYIQKSLEGILSQKTTFEYEVIIHDDASTDETTNIIKKYKSRYGSKIKTYFEKENQYSKGKLCEVLNDIIANDAKGEYVAVCEGDDFWIDDNKLQIQVEYMDEHNECVLTAHNSLWLNNVTNEIEVCNGIDKQGRVSIEQIIGNRRGCFATASMVIRREKYVVPTPFSECGIGDWPQKLYLAEQGEVYYFDRIMSVYNMYSTNSWSLNTLQRKNRIIHEIDMIHFLVKLNLHWKYKYKFEIDSQIESYINDVIYQIESEGLDVEHFLINIICEIDEEHSNTCKMISEKFKLKEEENNCLINFLNEFKYSIVMGCGVKARKLTERLEHMGVSIDGYAVSNDQTAPFEFNNRKVWRLCDIPYEKKDIAIIIGIQSDIREEIVQSLKENGIKQYFWPSV